MRGPHLPGGAARAQLAAPGGEEAASGGRAAERPLGCPDPLHASRSGPAGVRPSLVVSGSGLAVGEDR